MCLWWLQVQRLCQYPLLFREVVKTMSKEEEVGKDDGVHEVPLTMLERAL